MNASTPTLILPVENQVRELEPKLLLACVAAERGMRAFIGSKTLVDFQIASFPRGVYLCKSMTARSIRIFRIMRAVGHEVAALDEEAVVHYEPAQYYARRVSGRALAQAELLLAWGEDNAELYRGHPDYNGAPIHVTGNPRVDFLREELAPLFRDDAARIRERYGDFLLVNTNFSGVNAYYPRMNFLQPGTKPGDARRFGLAGLRFDTDFAEGLASHKAALFEHFQKAIPELAAALPNTTIVVRPHPTERRERWEEATATCPNVQVVHEGNVVPWLMAARALMHNGCTTAVEAYAMRVPAIAYQPVTSDRFDLALPNALSRVARDAEELREAVGRAVAGDVGYADTPERQTLLDHFLHGRRGPLASDNIADVLAPAARALLDRPLPLLPRRLLGRWRAAFRSFEKQQIAARNKGHRNNPAFQRHRYEGVSLEDLRAFQRRLGSALGRFADVRIRSVRPGIFEVGRAGVDGVGGGSAGGYSPAAHDEGTDRT